jgi:hypothetical protein
MRCASIPMDRRGRLISSCRGERSVLIMGFLALLEIFWYRELRRVKLRWWRMGCKRFLSLEELSWLSCRYTRWWKGTWESSLLSKVSGGTFSIRKLLSRYCDFLQSNMPILYIYAGRRRSPTLLGALGSDQWSRLESSIAPKANPCAHVGLLSATTNMPCMLSIRCRVDGCTIQALFGVH